MAKRRFRPPGNPILGHVLQIELSIPLVEFLSRLLGEIRRTAGGRRSIDRWCQGQVAARIVHEPAAVLTANIDRIAESHFGYARPALTVRVIVFHQDAVVLVNTLHPRIIHGWPRSHQRPGRRIGITAILGLAKRVGGSSDAISPCLAVQIILSDRVAVQYQLERVVWNPEYLSSKARLAVELGIGLPAIDEPGFNFQILRRPPWLSSAIPCVQCN